jgi:CRISPR/Cas system-associated endoribonuclease Cas2
MSNLFRILKFNNSIYDNHEDINSLASSEDFEKYYAVFDINIINNNKILRAKEILEKGIKALQSSYYFPDLKKDNYIIEIEKLIATLNNFKDHEKIIILKNTINRSYSPPLYELAPKRFKLDLKTINEMNE